MNILHLTHTNIHVDSRILKSMQSLNQIKSNYNVSGIGVSMNEGNINSTEVRNLEIYSISLITRKWTYLPTVIRHTFSLVELSFKMLFKAIKLKPKIIHCNDTLVLPLGVIVKLFTGAKLIYDAHELESARGGLSKTLGKMTLLIEKLLWRSIDALIVVSPSIDAWYKNNIGVKYSEVILNSPILEKNIKNINKQYLRDKFSIHKDSKIFLYIGYLGYGRSIDLLVEAFINNQLQSSLIFLGYGNLTDELIELSRKHKNIYIHNSIPSEKIVSVAQSADIGLCLIQNVSLSDYYCLPNKLFEYSFAEIPILASNFPDISKVVKQFDLGICTELNSNSIYKSIKEFEDMVELPKIDNANLYELSWGAQEKKLIRLYDKLIKEVK